MLEYIYVKRIIGLKHYFILICPKYLQNIFMCKFQRFHDYIFLNILYSSFNLIFYI